MDSDVIGRMLKLASHLHHGGDITVRYVRSTYGVSLATAKRDVQRIEVNLPVKTTYELDENRSNVVKVVRLAA